MKTKKVYEKPTASVEKFLANESVGVCEAQITEEYYDERTSISCDKFYVDSNKNHTLDSDEIAIVHQSNGTDSYIFTDYTLGWDASKNPQVGNTKPDCWCIKMTQGSDKKPQYSAFLLKHIVIVNRS